MNKPECFNFWGVGYYTAIGNLYVGVLVGVPAVLYFWGTVTFAAGAGGAAVIAALAMFLAVNGAREDNCDWEGAERGCWAGLVSAVVPSFSNDADGVMPWNAMHDRVDVVLKSAYWPSLAFYQPPAVTSANCNADPLQSPLVHCFYFSSKVCGAGLGATIGAGIAIAPGVAAGLLTALAIGCAIPIVCVIALIVAAIVAAVIVLAGALAGGQVGKALAPEGGFGTPGNAVEVGDYVSLEGKISGFEKGKPQHNFQRFGPCKIMFFVERTTLHGRTLKSPPYTYLDPDSNLQPDACARRAAPK